jgi:hypothetical protein
MAAIGALAGGMAGKYIYDKFGNKNPVAKKVAEAKSDASSAKTDANSSPAPSTKADGMNYNEEMAGVDRNVPSPPAPSPPNPSAKADGMNYNQEMAGVNTTVPAAPPPSISPTNSAQDENIIPGTYRRGGMVGGKASSGHGLSVRGGGKAVKGLGKVRVF